MPIYEYKCNSCLNKIELLFMPGEDENEIKCTQCGSNDLTRLLASKIGISKSASAKTHSTCCGSTTPCSSPKSCCGK